MAAPGLCPQCGDRLPADVPHGVCPKCMLALGFHDSLATGDAGVRPTQEPAQRFVPAAPADLAALFPQLEILELIGQGGMGAVYRARQKTLDRIVALKVLPPEVGRDPAFAERFTREAQSLARLTHPNIVMVFDFGETGGYYFFIMEYVDGVNLRQSMHSARLSPEQALAIVPQVCEALQYAHDEGIVHRDIKPENVLLDKRGMVKIADFGLAKLLGRATGRSALTGTGQVMGTPHYMAPEQMEKPLSVDHRADIYSLGVVFYELLTGELPLGRFAPPSQKSNVSTDLDEVVLRTLEKEPNQRYQHAGDVKTAVESLSGKRMSAVHASEEVNRLRVPFTIEQLYGGLAEANGILRFNGRELSFEFEVKDKLVGYVRSAIKTATVPIHEFVAFELSARGWFSSRRTLTLQTDQLTTLHDIPHNNHGRVALRIAKRDVADAQRLVQAVQKILRTDSCPGLPPNHDSVPPVDGSRIDVESVRHALRGPANGLLTLGILNCLTPVLLLAAAMVHWSVPQPSQRPPAFTANLETSTLTEPSIPESATEDPYDSVAPDRLPSSAAAEMHHKAEHISVSPSWLALAAIPIGCMIPLITAGLLISGSTKMKRLEAHSLAMTASVIALLPIHPWFWLGVPVGIWSLLLLMRHETKAAFRVQEDNSGQRNARDRFAGPAPPKPMGADANEAVRSLNAPAVGLVVTGSLTVIGAFALFVFFAFIKQTNVAATLPPFILMVLMGLLPLKGGIHMLSCRSYAVSMIGAVIAVLPLNPLWLITFPFGIWALVVLQRPEVKQHFRSPGNAGLAGRRNSRSSGSSPPIVAIAILLFLTLSMGASLAFYLLMQTPSPAIHVEPVPTVPADQVSF